MEPLNEICIYTGLLMHQYASDGSIQWFICPPVYEWLLYWPHVTAILTSQRVVIASWRGSVGKHNQQIYFPSISPTLCRRFGSKNSLGRARLLDGCIGSWCCANKCIILSQFTWILSRFWHEKHTLALVVYSRQCLLAKRNNMPSFSIPWWCLHFSIEIHLPMFSLAFISLSLGGCSFILLPAVVWFTNPHTKILCLTAYQKSGGWIHQRK